MPWKETCCMDQRMKFVVNYLEHELPMAALCREFGISRKTGYKFVSRYLEGETGCACKAILESLGWPALTC